MSTIAPAAAQSIAARLAERGIVALDAPVSGIGLAVWGVGVMGMVDNVLRPLLVGKETKLPDFLVLLSTIGGISIFGLNGFVIGPAIAALFVAAWALFNVVEDAAPVPTETSTPTPPPEP